MPINFEKLLLDYAGANVNYSLVLKRRHGQVCYLLWL